MSNHNINSINRTKRTFCMALLWYKNFHLKIVLVSAVLFFCCCFTIVFSSKDVNYHNSSGITNDCMFCVNAMKSITFGFVLIEGNWLIMCHQVIFDSLQLYAFSLISIILCKVLRLFSALLSFVPFSYWGVCVCVYLHIISIVISLKLTQSLN